MIRDCRCSHTHTHTRFQMRWLWSSHNLTWPFMSAYFVLSIPSLRPHKGQRACQNLSVPSRLRSKATACYLFVVCVCMIQNLSWVHYSFVSIQQKENIWGLFLEAFTGLDAEMNHCHHIMTLIAVSEYINTIERDFWCNNILVIHSAGSVLCIKI